MTRAAHLEQELGDREAIRDCLHRYCRGVDRLDLEMLASVFWPAAVVENSMFAGPAREWTASLPRMSEGVEASHHLIGNTLIDIAGDTAHVEAYWSARQRTRDAEGRPVDLVLAGRYLDRLARVDGVWRLERHVIVRDLSQTQPGADEPAAAISPPGAASRRSRDDLSYVELGGGFGSNS